ncbi:MAG: DUF3179 domain-containing protein [Anaerolineae bacterium]|nr:MAG: DUF3179 domain-containing protein [Anaerolineae bacterium]
MKPALTSMLIATGLLLAACSAAAAATSPTADPTNTPAPAEEVTPTSAPKATEYTIVTLLPFDAIPAIDNPEFLTAAQADEEYTPEEMVIGVTFNGESRAYSVPHLSMHEIVNDTVGGVKIAVTW